MKCPICAEVYGRDNELELLAVGDSILKMNKILEFGCCYCGFVGRVKLHPDGAKSFIDEEVKE